MKPFNYKLIFKYESTNVFKYICHDWFIDKVEKLKNSY